MQPTVAVGLLAIDGARLECWNFARSQSPIQAMDSETLLREISEYCRRADLAESTFGRLAINDGKLVRRLRDGGRITTDTFDRIRAFMARGPARAGNGGVLVRERPARADAAA